jgi:hypothetical protein
MDTHVSFYLIRREQNVGISKARAPYIGVYTYCVSKEFVGSHKQCGLKINVKPVFQLNPNTFSVGGIYRNLI